MPGTTSVTFLPSGLCVICEEISGAESSAYELCIPGGVVCEPDNLSGVSLLLAELVTRGAGEYDSRSLSDAFDRYGIRHSESAGHDRFLLRGLCLKGDEERALELLSLMVLHPGLHEDHIESIRNLLLFDIASLQDAPAERAALRLNERFFPGPHGRSPYGTSEGIRRVTAGDVRSEYRRRWLPHGSVLSLSGSRDSRRMLDLVEELFSGWQGDASVVPVAAPAPGGFYEHIEEQSSQLYVSAAFPSVPCTHAHYYAVRVFNEILSGGMYGRLFLELRERRGLCYAIQARYSASKENGTFYAHASTSPENASALVEVLVDELTHAGERISEEDLDRAKINLQTSLILGEEGVASSCAGNASDWWLFRRIRPVKEIQDAIEKVSRDDIIEYIGNCPPSPLSLVSLGAGRVE